MAQGKNSACRPLFTVRISPSCCRKVKHGQMVYSHSLQKIWWHLLLCSDRKKESKLCLVQMLKCQTCLAHSPSGWGACPGLSSCLSLSNPSENSKQSSVDFREKLETCWQMRRWSKQKSKVPGRSRFRFGRSDLGHEQALLVVQAGTHVTLQGFLQGLISGGHSERSYLAPLHTSATAVPLTHN